MRTARREFSISDLVAIIRRATDEDGKIKCERCGAWMKSRKDYEIDHVLAEGMRPQADLKRKLTRADGQLLCVAVCHPPKTKTDKQDISEAKRREAAGLGLGKPRMRKREKPPRPPVRVANGPPALARRGFVPARR